MPTGSAVCVWDKAGPLQGRSSPDQVIALRRRQFAMFELRCIMADLGDKFLFSLEGEETAVGAVVGLLEQTRASTATTTLWQATSARAHTGRHFTVVELNPEETAWVSQRVSAGPGDLRDIAACLEWAAIRARENAVLSFDGSEVCALDAFPLAVGGRLH